MDAEPHARIDLVGCRRACRPRRSWVGAWDRERGFTLVELVMVIAITGVIAVVAGRLIAQPVAGYLDTARRADLVDLGQGALHRMTRELRLALPNSIRVSANGRAVEMLRVRTGARYRSEGPGDVLDFAAATDTFDVIGTLADAASVVANPGAAAADCASFTVDCLVVYNLGQPGADAYALDNVAAVRAASATSLTFTAAAPLPFQSPAARFYVVDAAVSYVCDPGAGTLTRHVGYPINAAQSAGDDDGELAALGSTSQLLVDRVSACRFVYREGTASRGGLVMLELTMSEDTESVALLQQVHVSNMP